MNLASYAADPAHSRGRRHRETDAGYRSAYQRDRDRIVHSAAFRRLEYKTQVFVNHEGDLFRTRLTHSIEVAQIARTIARVLQLNEDLSEAIALAHDLGHTPFGHAGQDALNECMREFGGFEHNLQSLRVVDELEEKYAGFDGLNLTFETREGILKHCSRTKAAELGDVGERFLKGGQPSLEAQLANFADEIAYNNHDVDDGVRAGLVSVESLREVPLFRRLANEVDKEHPGLAAKRFRHEVVRRMINHLVSDLVAETQRQLTEQRISSIDDVRAAARPLIGYSAGVREENLELKRFLNRQMYRHPRVHRMTVKAARVVSELFKAFMEDPKLLPEKAQARLTPVDDPRVRARAIADYIAGMTDRYAIGEHERIFDARALG
jgi:dGTPase